MRDKRGGYGTGGLIAAAACAALAGGCANQHPAAPARGAQATRAAPQTPVAVPAAAHQAAAPSHAAARPPIATTMGADFGGGGGWVVGASPQLLANPDKAKLEAANQNAEQHPAAIAQVATATTADLNHDGFVTVDELLAMKRAGLPDSRMIDRLRATGDAFAVTPRQQQYLRDRGIDQKVIDAMRAMKPSAAAPATAEAPADGPGATAAR